MAEYISRDELVLRLNRNKSLFMDKRRFSELLPDEKARVDELDTCIAAALNTSAADVQEVRHGRWIEDGEVQICSECGEEHEWADFRATYCDMCGAQMDGRADNGE